jgi:hypothetical protein
MMIPQRDMDKPTVRECEITQQTKRRRRQTILIPTDFAATAKTKTSSGDVFLQEQTVTGAFPSNQQANMSPTSATTSANAIDLLRLVREYCSLPQDDAQRVTSKCLQQIEKLSGGYKLISSYQCQKFATATTSDQDALLENRRQILSNIIPVVEVIEQQRRKETEYIHSMTECRAEKVRRGKTAEYVYYDIHTQNEVSHQEYTRRYLDAILIAKVASCPAISEIKSGNEQERSAMIAAESALVRTTSTMASPEMNAEDEDHINSSHCLAARTPQSDVPCIGVSDARVNCSVEVVAIPVRGEVSSNPDIARAQERLWKAMDAALCEYSDEVMRIINHSATRDQDLSKVS